jgi:RNA polymerase sigma-32 factor
MSQTLSTTALVPNNLPLPSALGSLEAYIGAAPDPGAGTRTGAGAVRARFRDEEDLDAARELRIRTCALSCMWRAVTVAGAVAAGDLIQEGNIYLMKAVKRFDPDMGVRLVSPAVHWIRAEMHEFILKNWRIVKVATTKAQRKLFFNLQVQDPAGLDERG